MFTHHHNQQLKEFRPRTFINNWRLETWTKIPNYSRGTCCLDIIKDSCDVDFATYLREFSAVMYCWHLIPVSFLKNSLLWTTLNWWVRSSVHCLQWFNLHTWYFKISVVEPSLWSDDLTHEQKFRIILVERVFLMLSKTRIMLISQRISGNFVQHCNVGT